MIFLGLLFLAVTISISMPSTGRIAAALERIAAALEARNRGEPSGAMHAIDRDAP